MVRRVVLALLFGFAWAQLGPYVERTYDVRDLLTRPGLIILSPGFLTVVDVDEQVEQAVSARSDLFELRVFGNSLYLRPTKRAGTADLVVTAGGRTFLLRLVTDDRSFRTYRYRIRFPREGVVGEEGTTPPSKTNAKSQMGKPSSFSDVLPVGYSFTLTGAGQGALLEYRITNTGKAPVVADVARISVKGNGKPLSFRLLWREGAAVAGRILPGETERGALLVERASFPLTFSWPMVQVGGKEFEVFESWEGVK